MSATERKKRLEQASSEPVYRGILVRPDAKGGWYHREVAIPASIVEQYAEEPGHPPNYKAPVVDRIMRWLGNPDLIRKGWE